jgi:hypothetical protein
VKKPQRHISIYHHIKLIKQNLTWMQSRITVDKQEWWRQLVHTLMNKQWHIPRSQADSITKYVFPFIIGTSWPVSSSISANTNSNAATDFWNHMWVSYFLWMSRTSLKKCPHSCNLIIRKKKTSQGAKSGEYKKWGTATMFQGLKFIAVTKECMVAHGEQPVLAPPSFLTLPADLLPQKL